MEILTFKLVFWLVGLVLGLIFAREAYFIAKMDTETRKYLIHRFATDPVFWAYVVLLVLVLGLAVWYYTWIVSSNLAYSSAA